MGLQPLLCYFFVCLMDCYIRPKHILLCMLFLYPVLYSKLCFYLLRPVTSHTALISRSAMQSNFHVGWLSQLVSSFIYCVVFPSFFLINKWLKAVISTMQKIYRVTSTSGEFHVQMTLFALNTHFLVHSHFAPSCIYIFVAFIDNYTSWHEAFISQ